MQISIDTGALTDNCLEHNENDDDDDEVFKDESLECLVLHHIDQNTRNISKKEDSSWLSEWLSNFNLD